MLVKCRGLSTYVTGSLKASACPYHVPLCCKKFRSLSILLIKQILGIGNLSASLHTVSEWDSLCGDSLTGVTMSHDSEIL